MSNVDKVDVEFKYNGTPDSYGITKDGKIYFWTSSKKWIYCNWWNLKNPPSASVVPRFAKAALEAWAKIQKKHPCEVF